MPKIQLVEIDVDVEHYRSSEGHHFRREERFLTPAGNTLVGCWVLRDRRFNYIDHDQYRHDLMERHDLDPDIKTVKEFLQEQLA